MDGRRDCLDKNGKAGEAGESEKMPRAGAPIPKFHLYGEPHRAACEGFVHVENLDERSRAGAWRIRPHRHAALHQIFHVSSGGGRMGCDDRTLAFSAPCLLVVPAGTVHSFAWAPESTGSVITFAAEPLLRLVGSDAELFSLCAAARVISLVPDAQSEMDWLCSRMLREQGAAAAAPAVGHRAAAEAWLVTIVVAGSRALGADAAPVAAPPGHHWPLVARFRERIETHFQLREPVSAYAAGLGVTMDRLQAACERIADETPSEMIDERAMLEAKRTLLYTNLSISEIAYALGFADPAYFTRFFTRHEGSAPGAFRRRHAIV